MAARKWLTRGLCLVLAAALVGGGFWLHGWVKPSRVRQQLIDYLREELPSVDVEVESARLRLLGGIAVSGVKLTRRDDPSRTPFLVVPSAVIYPDKELLGRGRLVVRKIELSKPLLRVERDSGGRWNLHGLGRPDAPSVSAAPLVAVSRATVVYVDRRAGERPLVELREADLVVLNEPRPILAFHGKVRQSLAGPVTFSGKVERTTGSWGGTFDLSALNVGPDLHQLLAHFAPEAAEYARAVQGTGSARVGLTWINGPVPAVAHDVQVDLRQGRFQHPRLPLHFDDVAIKARCHNGHLTVEKASGRSGQAEVTLSLDLLSEEEQAAGAAPRRVANAAPQPGLAAVRLTSTTRRPTPAAETGVELDPVAELEGRLTRLNLTVRHLGLRAELFNRLPPKLRKAQAMFAPEGAVSLGYELQRDRGHWTKRCVVEPEGLSATYQYFRYPLRNVRGKLEQVICDACPDVLTVDLTAEAAGRPVVFSGKVTGEWPDLDVHLHVTSNGLPLEEDALLAALPEPYPLLVRRLHPGGRADVDVEIRHNAQTRRDYGPREYDNTFTITLRDAQFFYDDFPYRLHDVTGSLVIHTQPPHPTRLPPAPGVPVAPATAAPDVGLILFRDLRARHNGATLYLEGRKEPTTGGTALTMFVRGEGVPFDEDLCRGLSALQLSETLATFSPGGRMNCVLQARLFERATSAAADAGFNPAEDLELNLAFAGPSLLPRFFPYRFDDAAGRVAYKKGQVLLTDFRARHGATAVRLPEAEVLLGPAGAYWADLRGLAIAPFVADADFIGALPTSLRSACAGLELRGAATLSARQLVVAELGDAGQPDLPDPRPGPRVARGYRPDRRAPDTLAPPPSPPALAPAPTPTPVPALPEAHQVVYWDGKLDLAGASLSTGVPWEGVHGCFACRGRYDGDRFGRVLGNVEFREASVLRQPVTGVHARLEVDPRQPDVVRLPEIKGELYGGEVGGEGQLVLRDSTHFKLKLNASRVRLDELARQQRLGPKSHLEGLATAQLYLQNPVDPRTGRPVLEGGGTIDVPDGKLLNLPLILDLLKFIKGKIPDETAFEEVHALFRVRGDRAIFGQLDLLGNAFSLGGQGEMRLDGTDMRLEFYPVWSRLNNLLPDALAELTAAVSRQLFKFVVRGRAGGPFEIKKEPVPLVVDPARRVMAWMRKGSGYRAQGSAAGGPD